MANSETNTIEELGVSNDYQYGFHDDVKPTFKSRKGLDEGVINQMCDIKGEPDWMRQYRLNAYQIFKQKPMTKWGGDLSQLDFDDIYYCLLYTSPSPRDRTRSRMPSSA